MIAESESYISRYCIHYTDPCVCGPMPNMHKAIPDNTTRYTVHKCSQHTINAYVHYIAATHFLGLMFIYIPPPSHRHSFRCTNKLKASRRQHIYPPDPRSLCHATSPPSPVHNRLLHLVSQRQLAYFF